MVYLSITEALVSAIDVCNGHSDTSKCFALHLDPEPSLQAPTVGKPISHAQILAIRTRLLKLRDEGRYDGTCSLDRLLRGSRIWTEPSKPKPEKSDEYKALMARLRAEQEAQSYSRMLMGTSDAPSFSTTPTPSQAFAQRFPYSPYAHLFPDSGASLPSRLASAGEIPSRFSDSMNPTSDTSVIYDDASLATVNRQLALIGNVFVSIVATAIAIWWATWHWNTIARLGISMGGSGLVGVAEIVVYWGYIQRLENAKGKEKSKKEKKKVMKTWVIEGRRGEAEKKLIAGESSVNTGQDGVLATGRWPELPAGARERTARSK